MTIQTITRSYYKQLYGNKSEDFQEMERFLDTHHLPKLSFEATENLNRSVTETEIKSVINPSQLRKARAQTASLLNY